MTAEFNELLPTFPDGYPQIWILGTREQVVHQMNDFYVRRIATDRAQFTPIIPAPFVPGKYMIVLVR